MMIHLEIITPERIVFSEEVDFVVLPGAEGELTILPNHTPLFTKIRPGEVRLRRGGKDFYLAVTGGFLEVAPQSQVTILADYAVRSEEIEIARAEEAKRRAEETMREKKSEQEFIIAEAELRRALLELKVARRRVPKMSTFTDNLEKKV